jgi:oligoendopeptidase F
MLTTNLPVSSSELADASWATIAIWYDELAVIELDDQNTDDWLTTWSRLDELVSEAASRAMIAYTCDTTSSDKEVAHLRFSTEILPQLEEKEVVLARKFVTHGTDRADLQTTVRRFKTAIEIFREDNIPLVSEAEKIASQYQQITGGMSAEWEGERVPLPKLWPHLKDRDRTVREKAWRKAVAPYTAARDEMAGHFDQLVRLRQSMATNAGFDNYRDFVFKAKCRFDYTPDDCSRLHDSIAKVVVPAVERDLEVRRAQLGVDSVRPWDLSVDPWRDKAPVPYGEISELKERAAAIFKVIDPNLGAQFSTMVQENLLDLEAREGKAPGGYCDTLHAIGRPFVFMNAAGVHEDVTTLLHEAGHCFHAFASHDNPLIWQRHPGAESAELASMSMELLASPHLARPTGFYDQLDADSSRLDHLENVLSGLAHIASVDAFQSWIYTDGREADAKGRDDGWLEIRKRFERGVSWDGLNEERTARWYRQLHIFLYPFYYIEYAIAQIGALQVWRNFRKDSELAMDNYRRFLALGATKPLPELYRAAGVEMSFEADLLEELVAMVEAEILQLRESLAN